MCYLTKWEEPFYNVYVNQIIIHIYFKYLSFISQFYLNKAKGGEKILELK